MKLEILKFDHFGRGIGKINDKVIFVDKALPGEEVEVKITKEKKNYLEGKIVRIIKESSRRIKPICPFYNQCGGCNFLHLEESLEMEFKIDKALELFGKCDNYYETKDNYRNKCTLHVKNNKVGYYIEKTNEIVPINYCYLLSSNINKVIKDLSSINFANYNINKIIIKENNDKLLLNIDGEMDSLIDRFNYVDTIICNNKIVKGKGYLEEVINNKIFKITKDAFFQVNRQGLIIISNILEKILENKKINKALDLYSGTSLWGILMSDKVKSITSIEINKEACQNALWNIKKNNIKNIKVINGKVEDYIDSFNNIDLVIIDPPRSGLDKKTKMYLAKIFSKYLIYISCDMQTLKRDLEELKKIYKIEEINLINMFRRTYHCEVVTLLERK